MIKWLGYLGGLLLIAACFMKWVIIEIKQIVVTGVDATGTNFGKPGYLHLILAVLFLFFHSIPRVWAKRANHAVIAINLGWALRNYLIISMCREGDCPAKQSGLYLLVLASILMLVAGLFPNMKPIEEVRKFESSEG